MGQQGKINQPEHTEGGSQNKGTEKLQRRAAPSPLEVGGRGRGKGQTQPQRSHPLPHCKQASGFYLKTSWDSGWSTPAAGRVAARGQLLWTNASHRHPTSGARWIRGGKRRAASGERAPKPLAAWTAQAGEGTRCRCNRIRAKTGTALNAGPAPYRAAGSLSSVDGESTDTRERGKPSVAGTRWVLPPHSDVCLQRPALPVAGLNWTSEPK